MTDEPAAGRWRVSRRTSPPLTVCKWRSDVTLPDPERPFKITVGVIFNALAENGMPDLSVEREFLTAVENDLEADLPRYGAILVLSITGQGNREWVAYAPSHEWMQAWAPAFAKRWFKNHTSQISAAEDAAWTTYRAFSGRQDNWIYILSRSEGGKWLPFYVGQTTDVEARIGQHFRTGRLGPGTKWTVLATGGIPDDGASVGVEQISINLFGRKNLGRGPAGERNRRAGQAEGSPGQLRKEASLGTWGPGPFENDAALDWALALRSSADPELPHSVLRRLDEVSSHRARDGARAVAAAEAIAASRGHPAERLPAEVHRWLAAAHPRADAAAADLALGVLANVAGEDSELRMLWEEMDTSRWRATLDDLRRRLREPAQPVIPTLDARRPDPVPMRLGDVIQLLTSAGQVAYIQLAGRTGARGPAVDLIRIMPGLASPPLDDAALVSLVAGDTAFFSPGSFSLLLGLTGSQARGHYPIPGPCAGPQPVKFQRRSAEAPGGGHVRYTGQTHTAEEFAQMHPDVDQTMLTDPEIPSPGTLLRMIGREWRPWMADDDARFLGDDSGWAAAVPHRLPPYPATAQPGKFLLHP